MNPPRPTLVEYPDKFQNNDIPRLCPDWTSQEMPPGPVLETPFDCDWLHVRETVWTFKKLILEGPQNSTSKISQNFPLWIYSGWYCPRLSPDSVQNGHSQIRTSGELDFKAQYKIFRSLTFIMLEWRNQGHLESLAVYC